jgi:hypothetical protein
LFPPSPEFMSPSPLSTCVLGTARVGRSGTSVFGRGRRSCWCRTCRRGAHRRSAPLQPGLTQADDQVPPVSVWERERGTRASARGRAICRAGSVCRAARASEAGEHGREATGPRVAGPSQRRRSRPELRFCFFFFKNVNSANFCLFQ